MNYRLTVLSPLLVGDGQKLSPIDYMVWKDQINVLDQRRIFRLLAKGPRLEGYLTQIRKAEKLDFASWGGFAQNFAGRRIPFEHPSSSAHWEQARAESLHIPTFSSGLKGPFLPASAIKGALRTAMVSTRWNASVLRDIAGRLEEDRAPRKPGEAAEQMTLGAPGSDPMRAISAADSTAVPVSAFKIYMLRVATLNARGPGKYELGWKPAPFFAEMAVPGTNFTGEVHQRSLQKKDSTIKTILRAGNEYAASLLKAHRQYAELAGLPKLQENIAALEQRLAEARSGDSSCVVNLGWGGGFLGKAAFLDTENEDFRKILRQIPLYAKAVRTGMPFPKTRKIIFLENQPAALPGWALLEIEPQA